MNRAQPRPASTSAADIPPEEISRERGLLGGILQEPGDPASLATLRALDPTWCYSPTTRDLCARLRLLDARGATPDALELESDLRATGDLERLGGTSALTGLMIEGVVPARMAEHLAAVRTAWAKRTAAVDAETLRLHAMNGADPAALASEFRAAAERVEQAIPRPTTGPTVDRLGDDLTVTWPARAVEILFANAGEGREGLRAEVSATLAGRTLEAWGRLDLASPRARQEKAKALAVVAPGLPWSSMLDTGSRLVRDTLRAGEPARELQRASMTRARYLAHPLVIEGQVVTLFGRGGSGKSQLAHLIAKSLQSAVALPGMSAPSRGVPAVILDWETDAHDADALATLAASALDVDMGGVHYRRMRGGLVHHTPELRRLFQSTGARFGAVDSMMMACGDTLRDGWESSCIRFFEALRAIGDGIAWLVLTHMNRADIRDPSDAMPFGSIFTVNESRAVWYAAGTQDGATLTTTLTNTKINRGATQKPLALRLTFNADDTLSVASADPLALPTPTRDPVTVEQRLRVILTTAGSLTVHEMYETTGKSEWAIRKALARMADAFVLPHTSPKRWALRSRHE